MWIKANLDHSIDDPRFFTGGSAAELTRRIGLVAKAFEAAAVSSADHLKGFQRLGGVIAAAPDRP